MKQLKLLEVEVTQEDYALALSPAPPDQYCTICLLARALERATGEKWYVYVGYCRRVDRAPRYLLPPKAQLLRQQFDNNQDITLPVTFFIEVD